MHASFSQLISLKRWRYLSSVAAAFFILVGKAQADGWIHVEPALIGYDNLTRAQQPEDRRRDQALALQISGGHAIAFSGFDTIDLSVEGHTELYRRYSRLDLLAFGGAVGYHHKFGLGSDVPWMAASAHVAHESYRDDIRNGNRVNLNVEIGRRMSQRFDAAAGVRLDRRYGRFDPEPEVPGYSARVFDLQGQSIYARGGYAITERLLLNAQFGVRRGDVESTAQRGYAIYVASDAIAEDTAFRDRNLYAYRLRATTYGTTVTASWALSDRASLNLQYVDNRTHAGYALSYVDRALALSLAYRYP